MGIIGARGVGWHSYKPHLPRCHMYVQSNLPKNEIIILKYFLRKTCSLLMVGNKHPVKPLNQLDTSEFLEA